MISLTHLTERGRKILKYIKENPGISKEDVVRGMNGNPSRITVRNTLHNLEQDRLIVVRKEKVNSQIYQLFINNDNLIITVQQELDDFEQVFFDVIDKAKERFGIKENARTLDEIHKHHKKIRKSLSPPPINIILMHKVNLLYALLILYRHLIGIYVIAALFVWPAKIKDKVTLNKLYAIVFNTIYELQLKLFEVLPNEAVGIQSVKLLYSLFGLEPDRLKLVVKGFKDYGLQKELEPVMDTLWKILFDFIPVEVATHLFDSRASKIQGKILNWKEIMEFL